MWLGWAAPRACAVAWAAERSSALARGRNTSPDSVSRVLCGVRSNRRTPICCSRRRICRLSEGCATRSAAAARPKCRCSATATKYPTSRRSRSTTRDAESVMNLTVVLGRFGVEDRHDAWFASRDVEQALDTQGDAALTL